MDDYKKLLTYLFFEKSIEIVFSTLKIIGSKAESGDPIAKQILANYTYCGTISQAKIHALSLLARSVNAFDQTIIPYFDYHLSWLLQLYKPINQFKEFITVQYKMPSISIDGILYKNLNEQLSMAYWSIEGKLKINGRDSYPQIVQIACATHLPVGLRAKAIKSLSLHCHQKFDYQLPADPGYWKENDLRIKELLQWEKEDYPEGTGYAEPEESPALSNPTNQLEIACANLEKILVKERSYSYDSANPTNLLTSGDKNEIEMIIKKWKLPSIYLDFLERFSPLNVNIYSSKFINFLHLYGTSDLLEDPSFFGHIPSEYVIIGSDTHDIYVMDLSKSDGFDAPILYRSEEDDNFVPYASSFIEFLENFSKN